MSIDSKLIREVDLNSLLTFMIVYEERSASRAAQKLNVTQPAVSNTLAKLRIYLSDPLFVRDHNELVPTRLACSMAKELSPALAAIQRAIECARFA